MLEESLKFLLTTSSQLNPVNIDCIFVKPATIIINDDGMGLDSNQLIGFSSHFLRFFAPKVDKKAPIIIEQPYLSYFKKPAILNDTEEYARKIRAMASNQPPIHIFSKSNWVWFDKSVSIKICNRNKLETMSNTIFIDAGKLKKIDRGFKGIHGFNFRLQNDQFQQKFSALEFETIMLAAINQVSLEFPTIVFKILIRG